MIRFQLESNWKLKYEDYAVCFMNSVKHKVLPYPYNYVLLLDIYFQI